MALCEHSCDPNCCLLHDGDDLWFVALRAIGQGSASDGLKVVPPGLELSNRMRSYHHVLFECRGVDEADPSSTTGEQFFVLIHINPWDLGSATCALFALSPHWHMSFCRSFGKFGALTVPAAVVKRRGGEALRGQ